VSARLSRAIFCSAGRADSKGELADRSWRITEKMYRSVLWSAGRREIPRKQILEVEEDRPHVVFGDGRAESYELKRLSCEEKGPLKRERLDEFLIFIEANKA
jgi:hypothetical protein